jgi:hypothetical protein
VLESERFKIFFMTTQPSNESKTENQIDDEQLAEVAGGAENVNVAPGQTWSPEDGKEYGTVIAGPDSVVNFG